VLREKRKMGKEKRKEAEIFGKGEGTLLKRKLRTLRKERENLA